MKSFEGKVAIVTGGGGGIGSAICHRLAAESTCVAVTDYEQRCSKRCCRRDRHARKALECRLVDVADAKACAAVVADVAAQYGRVDILANNVEINRGGNRISITEEDWHTSFAANLGAMFYLYRAVLPPMIEAGGGAI
jgi:2-hydroxycyclohexanecarboxyl-CoA dehydrogenase